MANTTRRVQINPEEVPDFELPRALVPLKDKTAVLEFTESTFERQLAYLFTMPNEGEAGLVKANGLLDAVIVVTKNRERLTMMLAEIAHAIESAQLWLLFPGDQFASAREFWEHAGCSYAEIRSLLDFYFDVKPLLELVGEDPDTVFANTTKLGRQAMRAEVRQITRQLPTDTTTLTNVTKEEIKETVLRFQGLPDSQVKAVIQAQKGIEPSKPIYSKVQLANTGHGIQATITTVLTEDDVTRLADRTAYLVYNFNGGRVDWQTLRTLMTNMHAAAQNAQTGTVIDSTLVAGREDLDLDFGEESFKPLKPSI